MCLIASWHERPGLKPKLFGSNCASHSGSRWDAKRAFFWCTGFGYPDSAHWFCRCVEVHSRDEFQALWWCEVTLAIHSGCLFPFIFLCHLAHGEAFRTPGRGEQSLESVGFFRLSTGRCLVDSSLELEHFDLKLAPRHGVPFIPVMCITAHDVLTLLVDSTCVITVPLWAYPLHYQGLWLWGRSLPCSRLRVCVGLLRVTESVRGFPSPCLIFDAALRMSLSAGCPCGWILPAPQACSFRPGVSLWS